MRTPLLITSIFLTVLVFSMFFHPIYSIEQDLGRHLLLGRIIVQTMDIPKTNLLSYTNTDFPFINTHWLFEVISYLMQSSVGFLGLLTFTSVIATSAFIMQLVYALYVKKYHFVPVIITSLLYLQILLLRTDVRPELFSFLFLSITMIVLYSYRNTFTKWIFILPIIELLWVNIHVYFPIGILVMGIFLIDRIIAHPKGENNKSTLTLLAVIIVSSLVILMNPNAIRGATYPLFIFNNYGYAITENQNLLAIWNSPENMPSITYFFLSVLFLFSLLCINFRKTKPLDWLLTITFTIIAVYAERNLPLFVFTTFIIFSGVLHESYHHLFLFVKKNHMLKNVSLCIIVLFVGWQTIKIVTFNPFGYGLPTWATNAVSFLQQNNIKGPIFNNFDMGSYLVYRLYPQEKVFVDGRPEAYPASFFQNDYIPMEKKKELFQQADYKYHFNAIVITYLDASPENQQFLRDINMNPLWRIVYLDPTAVIYVKNTSQNKSINNTSILHSQQLISLNLTKEDLDNLHYFYSNVGWINEIKTVDQKLLELNPNNCFAIRELGKILQREKDSSYVNYAIRYYNNCR